jgi:histidinol phosphatase-like PHP family hydrolase
MGSDMSAAIEAFGQFIEFNSAQMTAEERATFDKRYERVCRNLGFPITIEELHMTSQSKVRAKSGK